MILFIEREYFDEQTLSDVRAFNPETKKFDYECKGLELPWKDNKRRVSCIPEGVYTTKKRISPRFANHFHITNVEGRDWILIHRGNFVRDILGCVIVGKAHKDIDDDGLKDVTSSVATMNKLNSYLPNEFVTVIYKKGTSPFMQF
jgi:hypothetical protein